MTIWFQIVLIFVSLQLLPLFLGEFENLKSKLMTHSFGFSFH